MATENIVVLNAENFNEVVSAPGKPVVVDFWAAWCGPCRAVSPIIEKLADELSGKVVVGKVNVDENQALAIRFQVNSIPSILFFKDGQLVNTLVGLRGLPEYKQAVESLI